MAGDRVALAEQLSAYLRRVASLPIVWGEFDCVVGFGAGWVMEVRGVDPAAPFRGTYHSPLGAARLMRAHGGLPALVACQCEAYGLAETNAPALGDVAVIWTQSARNRVQTVALRAGGRWAFLAARGGITFAPAQVIRAWRI